MLTSFTLAGSIGTDAIAVSIRCAIEAKKPAAFCVEGVSPVQGKEIAVRVRSALAATDLCSWPKGRVTISIDAQGAKLQSPALDLPIALAIAGVDVSGLLVAGELGLDGSVRPVRGVLQMTLLAKTMGLRGVLVPVKNVREALESAGTDAHEFAVHTISHLADVADALITQAACLLRSSQATASLDFADVRGQADAIAKVEEAVSSRAGLLLSGPPGTGKTMIARRIPGLMPAMSREEQIDVTRVYSAIGLSDGLVRDRPFRAPHHTISAAALAGASHRPGEVHLAGNGVLFLDELSEFSRASIEVIATTLSAMPAASRPLVVAAVNSCPCGWHGSAVRKCLCSADAVKSYTARVEWAAQKLGLSVRAAVEPVAIEDLRGLVAESTATIAARIAAVTSTGN